MYHFVVFPYDRTNEKILTWRETTSYGTVTDIVSPRLCQLEAIAIALDLKISDLYDSEYK